MRTGDMRTSYKISTENPKQKISLDLDVDGEMIFNGSQDSVNQYNGFIYFRTVIFNARRKQKNM
jgi:hypothetical protein